ncbi:histone deacetylase family protein [Rugamonas rubra]|uniref:Acetoin utilization deacetylase AcuC n=1 Tax=Rugamonas rubra TaxID=758825 RepID=A0A1I4QJP5_9BURK|nr:histone deacetylase family protein [Rugamonas rubra]SFM39976.1 Acetoin utilization deacetylase AcuC [Rugamonas rubra]
MLPAYISHPDCLKHTMGEQHPESPERIGAINDMLLIKGLLDFMQPFDAPLASEKQLAQAHSLLHIHTMAALSPVDGSVQVDPDTSMNPHTYRAALRAAGAAVLAVDLVLGKGAGSAFCNVRPPGHHAEHNAAGGFCFFNNVAVGIRHALNVHGLERVALVDFDVHHGNGSEDILHGDERVLMCSIFEDKIYPFCGNQPRGPNMLNVALPARSGGDVMRAAVSAQWLPALERFRPQLIVVSAGFDGHRDDDMGNLGLVEADYAWLTKQIVAVAQRHCQGRIVSCLEGGYELSSLARSAAAHVKVLLGLDD